jgi:hypothetical protein
VGLVTVGGVHAGLSISLGVTPRHRVDEVAIAGGEDIFTVPILFQFYPGGMADCRRNGPGQDQAPRIIDEPFLRTRLKPAPQVLYDHHAFPLHRTASVAGTPRPVLVGQEAFDGGPPHPEGRLHVATDEKRRDHAVPSASRGRTKSPIAKEKPLALDVISSASEGHKRNVTSGKSVVASRQTLDTCLKPLRSSVMLITGRVKVLPGIDTTRKISTKCRVP